MTRVAWCGNASYLEVGKRVRVGGTEPFSHPNDLIWEYQAYDYDEVLVGFDKQPWGAPGPREPVFRYSVRLPRDVWFFQEDVNNIYWLSVAAVYGPDTDPLYDWGWTNHKHVFNDDAVTGVVDMGGPEPLWTWRELYDQTGESEDMSFMLFTDPDPIIGTCLDPAECAGQPSGDCTCDGWVNLADLICLKTHFGKSAPWVSNECCADFTQDGAINLADLIVLKAGFGSGPWVPATGSQKCP